MQHADTGMLATIFVGSQKVQSVTDYQSNIIICLLAKLLREDELSEDEKSQSRCIQNGIFYCCSGSFSGLLHLQKLDLSNNRLHFIQYGVLEDLYFLSELKLGGNPWVCDYR